MVAQDRGLVSTECRRQIPPFAGFGHEHARVIEEHVIFEEGAGILIDRIEQPP
jgi:hypothetical protein